jgi:hypothetical protein
MAASCSSILFSAWSRRRRTQLPRAKSRETELWSALKCPFSWEIELKHLNNAMVAGGIETTCFAMPPARCLSSSGGLTGLCGEKKLGTRSVKNVSFQTRIRHSRMLEVLFSLHPKPFHNPNRSGINSCRECNYFSQQKGSKGQIQNRCCSFRSDSFSPEAGPQPPEDLNARCERSFE